MENSLKLCLQHKWDLVKRGYGSAAGFGMLPLGDKKSCGICNGEWKVNYDISQARIAAQSEIERSDLIK